MDNPNRSLFDYTDGVVSFVDSNGRVIRFYISQLSGLSPASNRDHIQERKSGHHLITQNILGNFLSWLHPSIYRIIKNGWITQYDKILYMYVLQDMYIKIFISLHYQIVTEIIGNIRRTQKVDEYIDKLTILVNQALVLKKTIVIQPENPYSFRDNLDVLIGYYDVVFFDYCHRIISNVLSSLNSNDENIGIMRNVYLFSENVLRNIRYYMQPPNVPFYQLPEIEMPIVH